MFTMKAVTATLAYASVIFAAPTGSTSSPFCKTTSENANFDDLTAILPGVAVVPLPIPYKGLYYQGFGFNEAVETNVTSTPAIAPHSGTQFGFSDVRETLTAGSAEWTVNYPNSAVKSFSPQSFYYACALDLFNGVASAPTACDIAITGFAKGDDTMSTVQVAAQEFSYNPSTDTGVQQMAQGVFNPAFKNLEYVLIQYTLPGGLAGANPDLGLAIDSVVYTTCA